MLTGSCHCQTVQYEISQEPRGFMHCHCQTCRKIHGTVYGSSALVQRAGFKLIAGEEALSAYESTPGKKRCFCSRCGTHVYAYFEARPDTIILRLGTIHGDPGIRPQAHIWVSHKAPWYEIHDSLPQYPERPDKR